MRHTYFLCFLLLSFISLPQVGNAQETDINVLIFSKTNGFTHNSITEGTSMITQFGQDLNWNVITTQNGAAFTPENLAQYDVVVWLNTSGNNLLTESQQAAFEEYIQNDNGFVGVHAATDTYRDGSWSWYNDLVGGIVQTNPNHTDSNTYNATMTVINEHPIVAHLGDSWNKDEEYYYWELNGGYLFDGNINLLQVEQTGNESYDAPRPITWYKEYDGGRSFYTALGHNGSDYTSNNSFQTMMLEAIIWAANGEVLNTDSFENTTSDFVIFPNPTSDLLSFSTDIFSTNSEYTVHIYDIMGKLVTSKKITETDHQVSIKSFKSGAYFVNISGGGITRTRQIIRQ